MDAGSAPRDLDRHFVSLSGGSSPPLIWHLPLSGVFGW
jgi:hypothetical protein